jgi:type I restriction enzyme S subunit
VYLHYYLRDPDVIGWIFNQAIGATMPNLNTSILRSVSVRYPSLEVQHQIAAILSAYDDLIENNTRRIAALEEAAQAQYREWFVEFRFPGHEDVAFVESELGVIPQDWIITKLAELFPNDKKVVMTGPFGSKLHAHDYRDEGVPLILVKHVKSGHIVEDSLPLVGEHKWEELKRYRLDVGDIVVTRVGYVGDSAYIHPRYENWFFSGQMLRVRIPDNEFLNSRFLAQEYSDSNFRARIENNAVGATRPSLNTRILADMPIIVPPIDLQQEFVGLIEPLDNLWLNLYEKASVLREARDFLLPRLISGEIDVSELEILGAP